MRAIILTVLLALASQASWGQTCAGGLPCDEAPPNLTLLIQVEPEGRLGKSFAWSIIGEQPFFKTMLSAEDMVQVAVPPGSYQITLVRASDQKVASAKVQIADDEGAVEKRLSLPPLAADARRMRLVTATLDGAAPHPRGWSWQFIQGDQVMGSIKTPKPTVEVPLEVGAYTLRVRKGREKQETRAKLIVEDGQGVLAVAIQWDPTAHGSDAVAAARIVPKDGAANPDGDTAQPGQPVLVAAYDAGTGKISVRLTQGAEALEGGTFWLTEAESPGGLGVQFIEDTLEAKFDAAGLPTENLFVEARDATGLAILARTKVEGWK